MSERTPHLVMLKGELTEQGCEMFTRTVQVIMDAMIRTEDHCELPEDENFLNDIFDLCEIQIGGSLTAEDFSGEILH